MRIVYDWPLTVLFRESSMLVSIPQIIGSCEKAVRMKLPPYNWNTKPMMVV